MASIKHLTETHTVFAVLLSVALGTVGCGLGQQKRQQQLQELQLHHLKELPPPGYLTDDVRYYPPGPEFKLAREKERLRKANRSATSTALDADGSTAEAQANSGG